MGGDRLVGKHSSFWMAGGTARVQLKEIILRGDEAVRGCLWLICCKVRVCIPTGAVGCCSDGDKLPDGLKLAADRFHVLKILPCGKQDSRSGVVEDVAPLRRRKPVVERNGDQAYV